MPGPFHSLRPTGFQTIRPVTLLLVSRSDASIWVLIIPSVLFFLILNGGAYGSLAWVVRRRKRWLDTVFTPLGLTGQRYNLMGRQYQGTVEGRDVIARFFRGPTLTLYLSTPLQTRLGVADAGSTTRPPLAHLAGREPMAQRFRRLADHRAAGRALLAG